MSLVLLMIFLLLTAILSWFLAFGSRAWAWKLGAVKHPHRTRDIHQKPIPEFGGLGIGIVLIAAIGFFAASDWFLVRGIEPLQISGFLIGIIFLLIGGLLDDRYDLPPWIQIIFPILAALSVMATGTSIHQITQWGGRGAFSLGWIQYPLTFVWMLAVTYAMKFLDGLDGLVTGQTMIGAFLIAGLALTHAYFQPSVAILAFIVAAAFAGFLPHNIFPAKQFLGEAGSSIAGFSLAFLAIVSGAKVATALMALGLPLADASLVILGRLARGASPFRGDDTHLHFKLLKAGLTQRQVVGILWAIALLFGLLAFGVQTRGKVLLLIVLVGVTILLPFFVRLMRRSRKTFV